MDAKHPFAFQCKCCYGGRSSGSYRMQFSHCSDEEARRRQRRLDINEDARRGLAYRVFEPSAPTPIGIDPRALAVELRRPPLATPPASEDALDALVCKGSSEEKAWPFDYEFIDVCAEGRAKLRAIVGDGQAFRRLLGRSDLTAICGRILHLVNEPVPPDETGTEEFEQWEKEEATRAEKTREILQACSWAKSPEEEKMVCANALIADGNLVMAACTRGNAVPYTLGAGTGSKGTAMYQMK